MRTIRRRPKVLLIAPLQEGQAAARWERVLGPGPAATTSFLHRLLTTDSEAYPLGASSAAVLCESSYGASRLPAEPRPMPSSASAVPATASSRLSYPETSPGRASSLCLQDQHSASVEGGPWIEASSVGPRDSERAKSSPASQTPEQALTSAGKKTTTRKTWREAREYPPHPRFRAIYVIARSPNTIISPFTAFRRTHYRLPAIV
ncbi:hypothetical protein C8Q77DRAFT_452579 [Trametes polyzona]|nr:hypothetical protein C8Q77DRAFT_452579 [Trametes polyzona]